MKNTLWILVAVLVLVAPGLKAETDESAKSVAVDKIEGIFEICSDEGLLACEPRLHGIDRFFEYVRLFDHLALVENEFEAFLHSQYTDTPAVDFDVLQVDVEFALDISITPDVFTERIESVKRVPHGYDIGISGDIMKLRERDGAWHLYASEEFADRLKKLEPFHFGAQMKRSILVYRMLEAEMTGLSKDELEARVSEDLAPVAAAVFGRDRIPSLVRWLGKDLNEIVAFYGRFQSVNDMKEHIRRTQ